MLTLLKTGGVVMWLIALLGLAALVVFVERALHLHRARIRADDFLKGIFNILLKQNANEALSICEDTPGPVPYLVKTAILHRHDGAANLRATIKAAGLSEIARMEQRLVILATTAQIAPLLGLLGTLFKLIAGVYTFEHQIPLIQSTDILDPLLHALTLSAAGIAVAIPCYVAFNVLVVKIELMVLDMERASSEIVAFFTNPARANGTQDKNHDRSE